MKVIYLSENRILLHQERKKLQRLADEAFAKHLPLNSGEILEQCRRVNQLLEGVFLEESGERGTEEKRCGEMV